MAPVEEKRVVSEHTIHLLVNGESHSIAVQPQWTLLSVLQEKLGLTGTKEFCGEGACGACTVIMDGRPVLSCMMLAIECEGKSIETIEGIAKADHPLIEAYIKHSCMQCGFCTPGFVVTAKARASIRHYLKHLQRGEAIILGKRLLEKALLGRFRGLEELPAERINALARELNVHSFDDILADIGLGNRVAPLIAKRLLPDTDAPGFSNLLTKAGNSQPLLIKGTEGTVVNFGKCCRPLPGDSIIGYLSTGRGIVIHRDSCKNVADYKNNLDKWIEVEWEKSIKQDFPAELRLDVNNKRGVFAKIAAYIAEAGVNIENINTLERDGVTTTVHLILNLRNRNHLAEIMRQLRTVPEVLRLCRRI